MTDKILGVEYNVLNINALEFSNKLKKTYEAKGIDYLEANSAKESHKYDQMSVPAEAYEYQNFFAYENEHGELLLLDGYRRLLWSDVPDMDINVRVYSNLSDQQLCSLMVYLNHFKFFANGNAYYDRGFALFYKTFFDIDILKIKSAYNGALLFDRVIENASYDFDVRYYLDEKANKKIKDVILEENYINYLKLIQHGINQNSGLNNVQFGTMIKNNQLISFDQLDKFLNKKDVQALLNGLEEMSSNGAIKRMNKIIDHYKEYLAELNGVELITFVSAEKECKQHEKELKTNGYLNLATKKDKEMYEWEVQFKKNFHAYNFIAVVYPSKKFDTNDFYGLTDDVEFYNETNRYRNDILNIKILGQKMESSYSNYTSSYPMKEVRIGGKLRKAKVYFKKK